MLYYSADLVSGPLKTSFKCLLNSGVNTASFRIHSIDQ